MTKKSRKPFPAPDASAVAKFHCFGKSHSDIKRVESLELRVEIYNVLCSLYPRITCASIIYLNS